MKIEFRHIGGPYGDCTSNYDVIIPENTTVAEFIKYIVREYSVEHREWGYFYIRGLKDFPHGAGLVSYDRGKAFYEDPWTTKEKCEPILIKYANRIIKKVNANGGWSAMNYYLYLEDKEK